MGYMREINHDATGPELDVGPVVLMHNAPTGSYRPAPMLGQHSDEVLGELGVEGNDIAALRACGAVA
jgi:crotonobetainyl-CoA:carnitine CoA-transferase CaiB-like acyl-CoA transferase